MTSPNVKWATTLASALLMANAYAGDKKEVVPMQEPEPSLWSISVGATVSSIKTTFRPDPGLSAFLPPSPGGSIFPYTGGAPQLYQDGVVGTSGPSPIGATGFTSTTPVPGGVDPVNGLATQTFHGSTPYTLFGSDVSDTELSVGPYIKVERQLTSVGSLKLGIFGQYTFTTAFDTAQPSASAVRFDNAITYDLATTPPVVAGPPFLAIYNAAQFNAAFPLANAQAPRNVITTTGFTSVTSASVNIYEHTFTLGLNLTKDLGDRVHLVLSTGPTLNLFDTGFSTVTTAFAGGVPAAFGVPQSHDSQKVRFGWVGQLGVVLDLDAAKRYFVEASADYHWVDPFDIGAGTSSARVNASSWGASLGFGVRF